MGRVKLPSDPWQIELYQQAFAFSVVLYKKMRTTSREKQNFFASFYMVPETICNSLTQGILRTEPDYDALKDFLGYTEQNIEDALFWLHLSRDFGEITTKEFTAWEKEFKKLKQSAIALRTKFYKSIRSTNPNLPADIWKLNVFKKTYALAFAFHKKKESRPRKVETTSFEYTPQMICAGLAQGFGYLDDNDDSMISALRSAQEDVLEGRYRLRLARDLRDITPKEFTTWDKQYQEIFSDAAALLTKLNKNGLAA